MLSSIEIKEKSAEVAKKFPVKKMAYFGSYADGRATEQSDLDLLVEFQDRAVSLLTILDLKYQLEEALGLQVDVIHAPIPAASHIKPEKVIPIYAA